MNTKNSRISGFYRLSYAERVQKVSEWANLNDGELDALRNSLAMEDANHMIENVVGRYSLPMGIATNFQINERDYLIPLVVEEPSVVAAVSNAAKLFRVGGGFRTSSDEPIMIGQIQVLELRDLEAARAKVLENKPELLALANEVGGSIIKRGGGAIDLEVRLFPDTAIGTMMVVHLLYDTRDAMGANAINTAVEHIAPTIESITGGRVNLRILSNLTDRRKAYCEGTIPADELAKGETSGEEAVQAIVEASVFAEIDPYRATTHNKGIMNGIDAVAVATGNDWRAIEAGAHAYAARHGSYSSLTQWRQDDSGNLRGSIELPLAVGTVGGATRVHPTAQIAMKILGRPNARELSEIMAAVGLAQNLGAIRALAMEGIQHGHMRMHARQLAVAAGAPSNRVATVAEQLIREQNIRLQRAEEIVKIMRGDG